MMLGIDEKGKLILYDKLYGNGPFLCSSYERHATVMKLTTEATYVTLYRFVPRVSGVYRKR
jgi:hypothetical protein